MKLKRFALRGLIVLFVAVALCMFFARTVQTITTPKVQLVQSTSGRFEDKMTFRAQVYFAETEEFTVKEAKDMNITVDKLYVRAGNYVKKGDIIFTAKTPSYEEEIKKVREDYDAKNKELLELDVQNRKLSKESYQNTMYQQLLDAQDALSEATYEARYAAAKESVVLTGMFQRGRASLHCPVRCPMNSKPLSTRRGRHRLPTKKRAQRTSRCWTTRN